MKDERKGSNTVPAVTLHCMYVHTSRRNLVEYFEIFVTTGLPIQNYGVVHHYLTGESCNPVTISLPSVWQQLIIIVVFISVE